MATEQDSKVLYDRFPDNFAWGVATAAYQIEGGWNEGGRGLSIWDTHSKAPGRVLNGDTGDIACDSYHKYKDDIALLKSLGVSHYRFSISWSRLLPLGRGQTNEEGVAYYNNLIDGLLAAGIQPLVTLYHWDLPLELHYRGGWTNPIMADYFVDYARLCFAKFGDRVKLWITFNEPFIFVYEGYGTGALAPGIRDPQVTTFRAAHNVIRAHARAYRMYNKEFRATQNGKVGITLYMTWIQPRDPSNPQDVAAAEKVMQCKLGWFANPILGNGDYPELLKERAREIAREHGYHDSGIVLPRFTPEDIKMNRGSADFLGLNYYTTRLVSPSIQPKPRDPEFPLVGYGQDVDPSWKRGKSAFLYVTPWGLRRLLCWIQRTYANPPVYITENGYSDGTGQLDDPDRVQYYSEHTNQVLKAIRLDGCDVRGYFAWSLMDNYEWGRGYSEKYGLFQVDFNDPARKRTAKKSAEFYKSLIRNNGFVKSATSNL